MKPYEFYLPQKGSGPFPLILILPILGRIGFLPDLWAEKRIAHFFTRRGFAAAIVQRDFFGYTRDQGIEQVGNYISENIERARRTLDELSKNSQIDSSRIGSLGISFGGVLNVVLTAEEPHIRASIIALAGGNLPEIIVTSRDPLVKSYCRDLLKGLGMSPEEFVSHLAGHLKEEPLEAAGKIQTEKVLMIIATLDRVVFPRYSLALREALGKPETLFLPLGHYFSLLILPYLEYKALAFFRKKFSGPLPS